MASRQVQTVLGSIDANGLGRTLTHEHICATLFDVFYTPAPRNIPSNILTDQEITLQNFGIVRQYPYSNKYNIVFDDEKTKEAVLHDINKFQTFGGGSIVENTSHGLSRNINFMVNISQTTGVNIIAGTGFYVDQSQSASILSKSTEELTAIIRQDLIGDDDTAPPEFKCGVIAEVGSGWPITAFERRAIEATAIVQNEVGCGVSFHPGRNTNAPGEIARLYLEAGGNAEKAVMSHLDRTICDHDSLIDFAKTSKFYCQFDLFGVETSLYQLEGSIDMPSDAQRIDRIKWLFAEGYKDRVLISHDIHTKHRLMQFGGHGFSHILINVQPQMLNKGLSQEDIDAILIENPKNWLGIATNYQPKVNTLN